MGSLRVITFCPFNATAGCVDLPVCFLMSLSEGIQTVCRVKYSPHIPLPFPFLSLSPGSFVFEHSFSFSSVCVVSVCDFVCLC